LASVNQTGRAERRPKTNLYRFAGKTARGIAPFFYWKICMSRITLPRITSCPSQKIRAGFAKLWAKWADCSEKTFGELPQCNEKQCCVPLYTRRNPLIFT
jgi:hypothetical protein